MASAMHQVLPVVIDSNVVANAFVFQYYHILYDKPECLYQFYQHFSKIGRPGPDEKMLVFTTLPIIHENLLLLAYGDFRAAEIITVDSQESYNGGVLVVVTGYFPFHEKKIKRKFIQTFFLAPQENGYFVLNDIFRLVDEPPKTQDGDIVARTASEAPIPPPLVPTKAGNVPEQSASTLVNSGDGEASKPDNGNVPTVEEIPPAPELVNAVPELEITNEEVADDSQKASEQENGPQDVPKISYASVVMKEKTGVLASPSHPPKPVSQDQAQPIASDPPAITKEKTGVVAPPSPPSKLVSQDQAQPVVSDPPAVMKERTGVLAAPSPPPKPVSQDQDQRVASDCPALKSDSVTVASDAIGNVDNRDGAEGASIYVKGLPPNATHALLENEFKKFGTIRNGGIQVINQWGFAYGFVEFEEADAAQRAIEASPVIIGGRKTVVEEKRSTSRGNRGRPSSGYGNMYRSEGVRGRGGYYGGGRGGYGRGEYGNRGGGGGYKSRRGNGGYHRTEGGGGRTNRGAYVSVNNNKANKTNLESDVPASG
ncbi:PREDICTED: putative G3BP-like protein [Tarenaya hassleriana]|uniref:putative G3BP-like protein n=1 Tax=Tarenaya hassleriana TaxID=28532 RepID=UPI00053C320D|nr:PREDICTED: putative G3BP-like protein [Tarenaya hassleriana]